ncbi:beta-lactamase family protein, partial [Eubacteriales bacterium OttesenSCG-928-A19]|nr:beta-lactamase family protein [Eubacteriales bacterium OttesenSCG-928-A19]
MRDAVRAAIEPYLEEFAGTGLIGVGDETVHAWSGGMANRDFAVLNRLETRFDTASITKAFTAAAVLALVAEGKLALDMRITALVDLAGTRISPEVTLEHLLTHTSGIADDADEEAGEDYAALFVDSPNYAIRACRDILPNFAYKEPWFAPGTGVRYNNCAFVLLGLAMEAVTGEDSRQTIQRLVFAPCGMKDTGFFAKDEVCPNRAEGYFPRQDGPDGPITWMKNIYSYPPIGTPDGGAYATVGDLERFLRAIIAGTLLPPAMTQAFLRPHSPFTRDVKHGTWKTGYAFEFILRGDEVLCMYKEGGSDGVDAITGYFPSHDCTVHMLANAGGGPLWRM